jgi:hypothetical protein
MFHARQPEPPGTQLLHSSREIVRRARRLGHETQEMLDRTRAAIQHTQMLIHRSDELLSRIPFALPAWQNRRPAALRTGVQEAARNEDIENAGR